MPQRPQVPSGVGSQTRQIKPVFVDGTGRRRRLAVFAGVGIGVGLLVSLTLIIVGLFTGSSMPVPHWPDPAGQQQQGTVADQPTPSPTAGEPTTSTVDTVTTTARSPTTPSTSTTDVAPDTTSLPGLGDQHRAKPSKTPGKPR